MAAKGFGMVETKLTQKLSVTGPPSNCPITDELISRMIGLETVQLDSGLLQNQIEELLGLYSVVLDSHSNVSCTTTLLRTQLRNTSSRRSRSV